MTEVNVKLLVLQGRPAGKSLLFPRGDYLIEVTGADGKFHASYAFRVSPL